MKRELKIGWIFGIVLIMTGCANVNDNPYHKMLLESAYAIEDSSDMNEIPIAGSGSQTKFNTLVTQPVISEGAYAMESDPFRSYATPSRGQHAGQTSINGRLLNSY